MPLAIQDHLLPGRTFQQRFEAAQQLGFAGVEVQGHTLNEHLLDIAQAVDATGLPIAAVNISQQAGYLSPHLAERETAIGRMRQAMANAVDLRAEHVVFVPHIGTSQMPDLTPYRSAEEIDAEMMIWLLRTVSDLAYALGVILHMQPKNHYETDLMNTVAQAAKFCEALKDYPYVRIAPCLFDMALEESDLIGALNTQAERIGYVHLCDSNHRLPGQGLLDFAAIADALRTNDYNGWLTITARLAGDPDKAPFQIYDDLPDALALLREVGLS